MRPLIVIGTRPEAIKLSPVVLECRKQNVEPVVALTGQHGAMVEDVLRYFGISTGHRLSTPGSGSLSTLSIRWLDDADWAICRFAPDCIVVQGDTTSALGGALAGFYQQIPIVHVEAGLRSGDLQAPFPEEMCRRVISQVATLHCAPTRRAVDHLLAEGHKLEDVHLTGQTGIDALLQTVAQEEAKRWEHWHAKHMRLVARRLILITAHRRENWGKGLRSICHAIRDLAGRFHDCTFVWPAHPSPAVQGEVHKLNAPNIQVLGSATYPEMVWLMQRSYLILTDSGGIQEEAPSLGKPVLVLRDVTERPEALDCGSATLVGTDTKRIVSVATRLLTDHAAYSAMIRHENPYGDGHAAEHVVKLMVEKFA